MIDKWVYIVSWTLVSISFNDCPQGDITEDEFGRKERTVNCYDSYVRTKRTFYDRGFVELDSTRNKKRKYRPR